MVPREIAVGKKEKLLQKALTNPKNLKFSEFVTLIKQYGLIERSNSSGHTVYKWNGKPKFSLTIQDNNGMAVPYQIKQFINHLYDQGWLNKSEE
jgi:hypothetical protein